MRASGSRSRQSAVADRRLQMAAALVASSALTPLIGCHAVEPTPAAPSLAVPVTVPVVVPSVMKAFHAPTGVYGGGDTQIHVGVFGYDERGNMVRVPGVPVSFSTTSG